LAQWECLWTEDGDDSSLNPDPKNPPKLDPKDLFLLGDPSSASGPYVNGGSSTAGTPVSQSKTVTWLRKTEYISRVDVSRSTPSQEPKNLTESVIDISPAAQIRDIEASFAASSSDKVDLKTLRHPNKPNIFAVESYEIFPDADIWANAYDLFRFSERPGERPIEVDDPRLDCAIMRPMESDGDHFLSYYLTKDDEVALQFKKMREDHVLTENEDQATPFHFVRDYETVKVEQEVPNEFLLVLDDGVNGSNNHVDSKTVYQRPKGAYYKNIERKMILKKKRVNPQETYDKWDVINVTHVQMSQEEEDERAETLAEVMDPMYLLGPVDVDADGEVIDDSQT